jgi:hypothetical protein
VINGEEPGRWDCALLTGRRVAAGLPRDRSRRDGGVRLLPLGPTSNSGISGSGPVGGRRGGFREGAGGAFPIKFDWTEGDPEEAGPGGMDGSSSNSRAAVRSSNVPTGTVPVESSQACESE